MIRFQKFALAGFLLLTMVFACDFSYNSGREKTLSEGLAYKLKFDNLQSEITRCEFVRVNHIFDRPEDASAYTTEGEYSCIALSDGSYGQFTWHKVIDKAGAPNTAHIEWFYSRLGKWPCAPAVDSPVETANPKMPLITATETAEGRFCIAIFPTNPDFGPKYQVDQCWPLKPEKR